MPTGRLHAQSVLGRFLLKLFIYLIIFNNNDNKYLNVFIVN